jgi:L-histidine N-alpha-methyltransferase
MPRSADAAVRDRRHEHAQLVDEVRVRASRPMRVRLPALDLVLDLSLGAEIRTEVSCKFTLASIAESAAEGGLALSHWYGDPEGLFALAVRRRSDP